jgi:uncharacterized protein (DUF2236 family)
MAYRALSTRAVAFTYGQRALAVGALHARLYLGTTQHTQHRATPYSRLGLTARLFESVFLGTKEEADRALRFTERRHVPVVGVTDVDGGAHHPKGSPYSASDPELMWWTAAFTLDSVEVMYDTLVGRLKDRQRQQLFEDFVRWACLFGMPESAAPRDYADFRSKLDGFIAGDQPFLTDEAKLVGKYITGYLTPNPQPKPIRPGFIAITNVVIGTMPERVRELYGFKWSLADEAAFQAVTRSSRLAHVRLPVLGGNPLLSGRSSGFYSAATRAERYHLRKGRPSMPGISDQPAATA